MEKENELELIIFKYIEELINRNQFDIVKNIIKDKSIIKEMLKEGVKKGHKVLEYSIYEIPYYTMFGRITQFDYIEIKDKNGHYSKIYNEHLYQIIK